MKTTRASRHPSRLHLPLWLSAAALGLLVPASRAADVTAIWLGANAGWSVAGNWFPGAAYPNNGNGGFTYDAIVGSGAAHLTEHIAVQNLTLAGGVNLNGDFDLTVNGLLTVGAGAAYLYGAGQLYANGGITLSAALVMDQRTLTVQGTLNQSGDIYFGNGAVLNNVSTLNWTGGRSMSGGTVNNTGTVNYSGGGGVFFGTTLNNPGTLNLLSGTVNGGSGMALNNSGLIDIKADISVFHDSGGGASGMIVNNTGTIRKSSGPGQAVFYATVDNALGTVDAQSGTIAFIRSGVIAGTYQNTSGAGAVHFADSTFTLGAHTFSGDDIALTGGELQLSGPADLTGLRLVGGSVTGSFSTTTPTTWTGSTLGGTYQNNGTLNWAGHGVLIGGTLNNAGTLNVTGIVQGHTGSVLNNSGLVDILVDDTHPVFQDFSTGPSGFLVNNTGTILKSIGSGTAHVDASVDNTLGTVNAQSGTLAFRRGGVIAGTYQNTSGAGKVAFDGGVFTLGNATFSGDNIALTYGGTLQLSGAVDLTGLRLGGGPGGGIVTGNFSTAGTTTWELSTLSGATYQNNGTLNISGAVYGQSGSVLNNSGLIDLKGDVEGFHDLAGGAGGLQVNNTGTIRKSAGAGNAFTQATLNNQAGGVVEVQSGTLVFGRAIVNAGTLQLGGNQVVFETGIAYTQTATGSIDLGNGGYLSTKGTTLVLAAGTLTGSGLVEANVINSGAIEPGSSPGTLNFSGNLFQTGAASMTFELAGTTPGTEHDVVNVGGLFLAAGTLNVEMIGGFALTAESAGTLTVMDTGSPILGTFANVANGGRLSTLDGSGSWLVSYGSGLGGDKLTLSAFQPVPEPWQYTLVSAVALAGLAGWRGRARRA